MEEKSIYQIMEGRREAERLANENEILRSIHKNEEYWKRFYNSEQPASQNGTDLGNGYLRLAGGTVVRAGTVLGQNKRAEYDANDTRELIAVINEGTRKRL